MLTCCVFNAMTSLPHVVDIIKKSNTTNIPTSKENSKRKPLHKWKNQYLIKVATMF